MTSPGKQPCVYILANKRNGTVYIGVTSDLKKRVSQHKEGIIPGFSADYGATRLVWFEEHPSMDCAITREKQLKKWNRAWKLRLIEQTNPEWKDLFEDIC